MNQQKICKGCGKEFTPVAAFSEAEYCKTGCGQSQDPYFMELRADLTPIGKPRMTRADAWKGRKCVTDYWKFKDELVRQAKEQNFLLNNVYQVTFFIPMPKSWSKKKRADMSFKPHESKPDIDNLVKSINDCLLPEGDSAVHSVLAHKVWTDAEVGKIVVRNHPEIPMLLDQVFATYKYMRGIYQWMDRKGVEKISIDIESIRNLLKV